MALLTWLVTGTRFGMLVRAAAENRTLVAALGIDEARLATAVFALGTFLAGLAGALALPREPANLGMDIAVIADAFVVTVVGGLGSIPGAFLAALLIGTLNPIFQMTIAQMGSDSAPSLGKVVILLLIIVFLQFRPNGLVALRSRT